ncbi:hypothetical protein SAMN06269185_1385 [Natronoarchaeum philippinense]|uniref:Uncharacterized protein n=1 Tax=Natronoarchaeum philippinense TaxID=558529 RepID=A0A285NQE9_NATPI|nr:DUF5813 family protein [Natronoarchaeum philippinense]SNZ11740.1 hypothetical protein SAMN06269185_1385 [Natronoarchaeum philippinense]
MTDDVPAAAHDAVERHGAFETEGDGYRCTTTPLSATVTLSAAPGDRDATFEVEVGMPSLDAVVEGERVADVVEDGWFDTLERRLDDAYDAVKSSDRLDPEIERSDEEVVARFGVQAWTARQGVDDAKAIVDYVEGTYVQGVIPGYEYGEPVAGLLNRAQQNADSDETNRGGTPL